MTQAHLVNMANNFVSPDQAFNDERLDETKAREGRQPGGEVWQIVLAIERHRFLIMTIVTVAVLITALVEFTAKPLYRSVATVQVELTDEAGTNQAEAEARNAIRVVNEAKIYSSRAVAAKVVQDLNLTANPKFMGSSLPANGKLTEAERARAVTRLSRMVAVVSNPQSDLIDIEVTSSDPVLGAKIANQYPVSAQHMRVSRRQEVRSQMLVGLESEAKRLSAKLAEAETDVAEFRKKTGMLQGAGGEEDLSQINRVAVETASALGMGAAASQHSAGVARAAGIQSVQTASSPLLQQEQRQYAELKSERTRLSSLYGSGHPQMISLNNQINALETAMARDQVAARQAALADASASAAQQRTIAASDAAAASARSGQLQSLLNQMTTKAFANNENKGKLAQLERASELARNAYLSTQRQADEIRSAMGVVGVNSTLISAAVAPSVPFSPKIVRAIAGALLASLMISLLIVFVIELLDNRLCSPRQILRLFNLRTFGMFPIIAGFKNTTVNENPVIKEPHSLFAEVARGVHSEVRDLAKPNRGQTILVTSPLPGEGKSTVAITLCAAACTAGQRAIVVDFDLRRPGVMQEIQRQISGPDLIDLMLNPPEHFPISPAKTNDREFATYKPVVVSIREPIRNPSSVFSQSHVDRFVERVRQEYDLVIINGPSALAVQDARTLSRIADNVLLVLRWGQSTIPQVNATLRKLGNRVDGAVFDHVDYAEHARRAYGDEVQYYMESSPYYTGSAPVATGIRQEFVAYFRNMRQVWAAR